MRLLDAAKAGILISTLGFTTLAHAYGTTITTVVCGPLTGSMVSITSPASDSTVNQASFLVSGMVSGATQIEVRIDDVYNSTIPVSVGQTQYLVTVTLTTGTHTIKVIANDICAVKNDEASLVVTYQPSVVPTPGSEVPTETDPTLTPDGSAYVGNVSAGVIVTKPKQAHATGVIVMPYGSSKTSIVASLPQRVIDESKPETPSPIAPVVAAVPFVAGGGAVGFWWKFKWFRIHR